MDAVAAGDIHSDSGGARHGEGAGVESARSQLAPEAAIWSSPLYPDSLSGRRPCTERLLFRNNSVHLCRSSLMDLILDRFSHGSELDRVQNPTCAMRHSKAKTNAANRLRLEPGAATTSQLPPSAETKKPRASSACDPRIRPRLSAR